jgi:hypothetical protein
MRGSIRKVEDAMKSGDKKAPAEATPLQRAALSILVIFRQIFRELFSNNRRLNIWSSIGRTT